MLDSEGDPNLRIQSKEWDEGYIPLVPEGPLAPKIWWKETRSSDNSSSEESSGDDSSSDEESSGESSSDYDSDEFIDMGSGFGQRFAR